MARLFPILIGIGVGGVVLAIARESLGSVNWGTTSPKKTKQMAQSITLAAKKLRKDVLSSASKWARLRKIPLSDVLSTIVLESRGNPKAHAVNEKEDSRGVMQVNVRAHQTTLKKLGYKPDDLYKLDIGIEVGTYILKGCRDKVLQLVKASAVKQFHDISILTRLRYAGPKYVDRMIVNAKSTKDTIRPFKNAEIYIAHWQEAKTAIDGVLKDTAYA